MRLCDWGSDVLSRAQHGLECTVVVKEACLFGHHKLFCARIQNVVDGKRRRCPLRKNGGGLPKQHDVSRGILACRVKYEEGEPSESMVEARSAALWGYWVADADCGASLTVTGGGALSRVAKRRQKWLSLRPSIGGQPGHGTGSQLCVTTGASHPRDGGETPRLH